MVNGRAHSARSNYEGPYRTIEHRILRVGPRKDGGDQRSAALGPLRHHELEAQESPSPFLDEVPPSDRSYSSSEFFWI